MNSAKLDKSQRLQRVLSVLQSRDEASTLDIVTQARVCAVNSCISELRDNGHMIRCMRRGDTWLYSLVNKNKPTDGTG